MNLPSFMKVNQYASLLIDFLSNINNPFTIFIDSNILVYFLVVKLICVTPYCKLWERSYYGVLCYRLFICLCIWSHGYDINPSTTHFDLTQHAEHLEKIISFIVLCQPTRWGKLIHRYCIAICHLYLFIFIHTFWMCQCVCLPFASESVFINHISVTDQVNERDW